MRVIDVDDDMDVWLGGDIADQRAAGSKPYFAVCSHLMTDKESQPIVDQLLYGSPTPAQAITIAMYKGRSYRGDKKIAAVFQKLSPDMSAAELFQLAEWFPDGDIRYPGNSRWYFVQSVLKNLWGDTNAEFGKEQEEWAAQTSYLKDLLPLDTLLFKLSSEEQMEHGVRPLEEVVETKYTLPVGTPFPVAIPTNRVHCWNVYRKDQSFILRETNHKGLPYQYDSESGYDYENAYNYVSIAAGATKDDELELEGRILPVTIQVDPQGESWSIRISDKP